MKKFYRVIKENFLWEVGTILTNETVYDDSRYGNTIAYVGYKPTDDVYKNENAPTQTIHESLVENCSEYFERVYQVNILSKVVYKSKELAKEYLSKEYTD